MVAALSLQHEFSGLVQSLDPEQLRACWTSFFEFGESLWFNYQICSRGIQGVMGKTNYPMRANWSGADNHVPQFHSRATTLSYPIWG